MNNYTKFLADLANIKEVIKDEDKPMILLSSLPDDEYETFILALINGKQPLSYNEVSTALVNHELRKKDKESFNSTSVKELTARGLGFNYGKGKKIFEKSKTGGHEDLKKNQCAFCKGH